MTSPLIDTSQPIQRDMGKLFATSLLMAFAILLGLLWLWKLRPCAPDVLFPALYVGVMGAVGFIGTLILLFRLRRKLRRQRISSPQI
jgi:hypothetical protein